LGSLPESDLVRQSVARQKAMSGLEPDSPVVQKLNTLVNRLMVKPDKQKATSVPHNRDKKNLVTSDI
jgi:hypothetical protein